MSDRPGWTQEELVERVAVALAGAAYPGAPNGRIRDVPDRRTVRWYTTIGLVDRPSDMRGRTALYGQRHLLQIVAVKRLQAQGLSIAEIQAELVGATNATLRRVAAVADEVLVGDAPRSRRRFWTDPPATAHPAPAVGGGDSVTIRAAIDLPGGAVLLLPGGPARPADPDLRAIREAAKPLLDLLIDRGLLNQENTEK